MKRAYADALGETARETAKQAIRQGRLFLGDKEKVAHQIGKRLSKSYPALVHDARDAAVLKAREVREMLKTAGHGAAGATARLYRSGVSSTEFQLLKIGAIYALFAWLRRNPRVAEVTETVKQHVKAEPVESAVIALGIGFLIGRILG